MAVTTTNLGVITAYGDAVAAGYTGTKAEWQALMASYATVGQQAVDAKNAAVAAKDTAVAKATEATTAASTATTKANEASASAQSIAQSAAQIQENTDDIDQLKSNFADMESDGVVPSAEQILTDKGITDSVPYHFRPTGGDGADREYVDAIVGGSVVWNQLIDTNSASVIVTSGHKYYANINGAKTIGASTGTAISINDGTKDNVIDLTQMFGSTIADHIYSLEQATAGAGVAFFKALFPNDYYPYNAGELVSVSGLSEHKTVGFNVFNGTLQLGTINSSGGDITGNTRCRTDYIRVFDNTVYYFALNGSSGQQIYEIYAYDLDKNHIEHKTVNAVSYDYTLPSRCAYVRVLLRWSDNRVTTIGEWSNMLCINLSDPAKNGTYEPYDGHSYALDDSLTLRGIPKLDANNQLYYDGDTYDADGTVTRKYGVVDLGTLVWVRSISSATGIYYFSAHAPGIKLDTQLICSKYMQTLYAPNSTNMPDKSIYNRQHFVYTDNIIVKDDAYTDETSFKTAMSGVMLVYELATPTTEEADPYQHLQQCDPNGTEEYVSTGIVPIGHNSFYPENLKSKIEGLPWNFASLIAPTESTFTATRNYTTGALFIVNNVLYKATSNIANGGTITPNTNCTATTLAEIISELA